MSSSCARIAVGKSMMDVQSSSHADCSCIGLRIWLVPYAMSNDCMKRSMSGQGLTHREPALDEQDFERYVKSLFPLMVAGRDVLWVLGGRTDTNRGKCCTFATT